MGRPSKFEADERQDWLNAGVLDVRGIRKLYGDRVALDSVDLFVAPGEVCALLGPNGAGKSTLVSAVAGLRRPDRGTITIGGTPVWPNPRDSRRLFGLAPQNLGVYLVLSVRENLRLFGELAGLRRESLARAVDEVAEALELTDLLERPVRHLLGGEQRRVHTAMAMIHRPPLLLLDEPTTGVDVATRSRLLDTVRSLAADRGCAVLYSTHYLAEVAGLRATVVIVDHGRVLARGPLDVLIAQHGSAAVEFSFDGPAPAIAGGEVTDDAGRVRVATSDPPGTIASTVTALGTHANRLRGVEISQADLESVFLALTGRRYRDDNAEESAQPEQSGDGSGDVSAATRGHGRDVPAVQGGH